MNNQTVALLVIAVYLAACLWAGLRPSKDQSDSATGFIAGDRALGPLLMYFITGATIFSAFTFLGMPGWAWSRGASSFYILSYGVLGFVPFLFLGPRAARVGKHYGFVTQAEMIARRFSAPYLALILALITLIAFVPYIVLQMRGAGVLMRLASGGALNDAQGIAIVYGVVAVYVLKSGVLGVGWTNVLQGVFMLVLAWGLGLYLPSLLHGGIGPMFEKIAAADPDFLLAPGRTKSGTPWNWAEYSSFVLVSMIGFTCWPHLFMKAFSARDERTLRKSVILYPSFLLFQVPILLLGFAAVGFQPAPRDEQDVLPHLLLSLDLPAIVVGLFCAGGLAASMSTGDALAHGGASIAIRDGWVTAFGKKLSPHRERTLVRWMVALLLVGCWLATIRYGTRIVDLLVFAYGPITQIGPVLVAALLWRRATAKGACAGLICGIVISLWLTIAPELRPWPLHAGLYGLTANVLVLVLVSLATQSRNPKADEEFLAIAARSDGT